MTAINRKTYDYAAVVDKINNNFYYKADYRRQIFKYLAKEEDKKGSREKSATWNMLANLVNDETAFEGHIIQFLLDEFNENHDKALEAGITTVYSISRQKGACEKACDEFFLTIKVLFFMGLALFFWWMYSIQKRTSNVYSNM